MNVGDVVRMDMGNGVVERVVGDLARVIVRTEGVVRVVVKVSGCERVLGEVFVQ